MVALVCAVVGYAQQSTLVATLTHEETITSYYGTFAFQKAVKAAVSGDVITLSGGIFKAERIDKPITVRGAGMDGDNPTVIVESIVYYRVPLGENYLTFEGVKFLDEFWTDSPGYADYFERKICFNKCDIKYLANRGSGLVSTITNCVIHGGDIKNEDKVTMINCIIDYESGSLHGGFTMINCVTNNIYTWNPASFVNCIFINNTDNNFNSNSLCIFKNCVCIGNGDLFTNTYSSKNCYSGQNIGIFEGSDWKKPLTEAAKGTLKGDDGSEVGIYGGFLPWSTTPSYPQITKLNISNRTTSDGQLSVEVEVNSVQQQ